MDETLISVLDADDLESVFIDGLLGHGPDDRIQARTISPAGKDSNLQVEPRFIGWEYIGFNLRVKILEIKLLLPECRRTLL